MHAANRFSILAGLNPSPETKWAFDFVPTPRSGTKRRGRRGGKQQRLRHSLNKACEKSRAQTSDETCGRFAASLSDDDAPTVASQKPQQKEPSSTPTGGSASAVDSVRHHWAPQFRPNSLPTSKPTVTEPTNVLPTTPSQLSKRCEPSPKLALDSWGDALPSKRTVNPRFPLSAFLKDLASPTDCLGYWPPKTPAPEPASPAQSTEEPKSQTAAPLATPIFSVGAGPACGALVLSRNTINLSSNAVKTHQAVPTTPPLSNNTGSTFKHFPAFGVPTFAPPPAPASTALPALALLPSTTSLYTVPASSQPTPSPVMMPSTPPVAFSPLSLSIATPSVPLKQQTPTSRPSRPPAPQRSPWGWQEVSEGVTVFRTSPSTLITAPITSPYPFVYPPRPWTPTAVSEDLFKDTAAVPSVLRRKRGSRPSSPEVQKELAEFLDMGHADDCWCSSSKHMSPKISATVHNTVVHETHALELQAHVEDYKASSSVPESDVVIESSPVLDGLPDLQVDTEDDFSDYDAVLVTPSLEGTSSGFEDLVALEEFSQASDSDDEEWIAVSPRLQFRRPGSLPHSQTVSNASTRTSDPTLVAISSTTSLPSPPQTPVMLACQARVSDAESETGFEEVCYWAETQAQSLQNEKRGMD